MFNYRFVIFSGDYDLFDRIRGQDIRLLKTLRVKYICDLMVEKKKVKFGMRLATLYIMIFFITNTEGGLNCVQSVFINKLWEQDGLVL